MKNKQFIRIIVFTFLAFLIIAPSIAQPMMGKQKSEEHKERIQSMKIAFITERLSLTTGEAQEFWPVYNQYQKELNELRAKHAGEMRQDRRVEELTEEEAAEYAECEIGRIEETAELKRKYHEKFMEILPVKKVALLYEAEKDFNRRLFREMRRRQRDRRE